jgi:20S proteasome alpha/beta subunit
MTAIVGVLCGDGIVIGSDSTTTFVDSSLQRTIEQQTKKVTTIGTDKLMCGTGEVGLSQRFYQIVSKYWEQDLSQLSYIDIGENICRLAILDHNFTAAKIGSFGALLAFPHNNNFYLCEFPAYSLQPEFKTNDIWYVSMGSGQNLSDPFLGFVRKIIWNDKQPNLKDGIFGAILSLNHAIEMNPGGIGGPVQIGTLSKNGNNYESKIFDEYDMAEHIQNVENFTDYMKKYKNSFSKSDTTKPPG